ncbi:hemicentin-1-like [Antedon mediterranea]|uniref:hemicentin-1-like n=1 Tax=Antedon mediterranea TaxID=105859 RepID=UPI003AF6BF9E
MKSTLLGLLAVLFVCQQAGVKSQTFNQPQVFFDTNNGGTAIDTSDYPEEDDENSHLGIAASTLTFVFDVTGSMYDDLVQVIEGAAKILEETLSRREQPLQNFALVPFHDPEIGPVSITDDPEQFQQSLRNLYVQGGGDCPEMSVGAILTALNISLPGSFIYVFTDARSKDYYLTDQVLRLIQEKESQVVFVLTGDCGNTTHEGFKSYEKIAATSSGQLFKLNKSDVDEVLTFVKVTLQARKVNLLSADYATEGFKVLRIPIDTELQQITVSVSGVNPRITIRDPSGKLIEGKELLRLENGYVVSLENPRQGIWQLIIGADSQYELRVTGLSSLDFAYGFAKQPIYNIEGTERRPIRGIQNYLVIESKKLFPPGVITRTEFLTLSGEVISEYPLQYNPDNPLFYNMSSVTTPDEYFYIRVSGVDRQNFDFQRTTKTAISLLIPDPPKVSMPAHSPGYYDTNSFLTCYVESMVPIEVQFKRNGASIGEVLFFSGDAEFTHLIERATNSDEGYYECWATNAEGIGSATTYLDVTEPPPTIQKPENVTTLPGANAVLSCQAYSTVKYNITWTKPNSFVRLRENEFVRQLSNGSLLVMNVRDSDGGRYRCTAANEGGSVFEELFLLVQEVPVITILASNVTYTAGMNLTLNCFASGYPTPIITWSKNNQELPRMTGLSIGFDNELIIHNAGPDAAGSYSCDAINPAGYDTQSIVVEFTAVPEITLVSEQILVAQEETVILTCPASGIPPPSIVWMKDSDIIDEYSYYQVLSDGSLEVPSAQTLDEGLFRCIASNIAGTATASMYLEIGSIPRILQPPDNVAIDIGLNASFPCLAFGFPKPIISWRRIDGKNLNTNPRVTVTTGGALHIRDLTVDDAGTYICIAENKFGKEEETAQLRITGLVRPYIFSSPAPEEIAIIGMRITLNCRMEGNPPPQVYWYKNDIPVNPNLNQNYRLESDGSLTISNIQEVDAGVFKCEGINVAGQTQVESNLVVQVPPRVVPNPQIDYVVNFRQNVTLKCPTQGYPLPMITWSKGGQEITTNNLYYYQLGNNLIITSASADDAGTYTCDARNPAGTDSLEISLFVNIPPKFKPNQKEGVVNVVINQTLWLPCSVDSVPAADFTWYKNGFRITPTTTNQLNNNETLWIGETKLSDSADYICVASNIAGNISKTFTVNVWVPPTIVPDERVWTVHEGDDIVLPCIVQGIPTPEVEWQKDGRAIKRRSQRLTKLDVGSLEIISAIKTDTGTYICSVRNDAGTLQRTIFLDVYVQPEIIDQTQVYDVNEQTSVTLSCSSSGIPSPQITWMKDGKEVVEATRGDMESRFEIDQSAGTLTIHNAIESDTGIYVCTVSNPAGITSKEITLLVNIAPVIPEWDRDNDVDVVIGNPIELPCEVESTPSPYYTWYKDDNLLNPNKEVFISSNGNLGILRTTVLDSGIYTCIASNIAGNISKIFRVEIQVPPTILPGLNSLTLVSGETAYLKCEVDGIPYPQVMWHKDGQLLNIDQDPRMMYIIASGMLSIDNVQDPDTGEYECYASNPAGQTSRRISMFVQVPPLILDERTGYEVIVRNPVTLNCPASGIPEPEVTWYKDSILILKDDMRYFQMPSGSLQISSTVREDRGEFKCSWTNAAGSDEKITYLTVHVPPRIIDLDQLDDYNVIVNMLVTLECPVDSFPPPVFIWEMNSREIDTSNPYYEHFDDGSLVIRSAQLVDTGEYKCIAMNVVGNTSRTMQLKVQVPPEISDGPTLLKIMLGEVAHLPCEVSGVPPPDVIWQKDGRVLDIENNNMVKEQSGSLTIYNAVQFDSGAYTCVVTNEAGSETRLIKVKVLSKPYIRKDMPPVVTPTMGTSIKIPCSSIGLPYPEVHWYKDNVEIQKYQRGYTIMNDGTLSIASLQPYDSGNFTCIAENEAGRDSVSMLVDTQVQPRIAGENTIRTPSKQAAMLGKPVNLFCNVTDGHPDAFIQWYRDGNPVYLWESGLQISEDGMLLQIPSFQEVDVGIYECIATNTIGNSTRFYDVSIYVPPTISQEDFTVKTLNAGATLSLFCEAYGTPPPRYIWKINNIPLSSTNTRYIVQEDGSLTIRRTQVFDSGIFMCVAQNIAGNDSIIVDVRIFVKPSISKGPQVRSVVIGDGVILPCEAAGVPRPSVTWQKNGVPLIINNQTMEQMVSGTLHFLTTTENDPGTYRCIAENEAGVANRKIFLNVLIPPSPTPNSPDNVAATITNDVTIPCVVTGSPRPQVTWWKNNRQLQIDGLKYIQTEDGLKIRRVDTADAGVYTCYAINDAGVLPVDVEMTVQVPPKITGSTIERNKPVVKTNRIYLECSVTDAYPPAKVSWYKNDQLISGSSPNVIIIGDGRALEIRSSTEDDTGNYFCMASNVAGNATKHWNIEIQVPPTINNNDPVDLTVVIESGIVLPCEIQGYPQPYVKWYKDGQEIFGNNINHKIKESGSFEIKYATAKDSGTYICRAYNTAGNATKTIHLITHVPPRFGDIPIDRNNIVVSPGDPVLLPCEAVGNPRPNFQWSKEGLVLPEQSAGYIILSSGSMYLNSTRESDKGTYTCFVSNIAGTIQKDIHLFVQERPNIESGALAVEYSPPEGKDMNLLCPATGTPVPDFHWFKDGVPVSGPRFKIKTDGTLQITDVLRSDSGSYQCLASNIAGNTTLQLDLVVRVPPRIVNSTIPIDVVIFLHNPLNLICEVVDAVPYANINWKKNGETILDKTPDIQILDNGQTLHFPSVVSEHGGRYTCIADNGVGQATKFWGVTVHIPPVISGGGDVVFPMKPRTYTVTQDKEVILPCNVSGNPKPTIRWYKDGNLVTPNERGVEVSRDGQILTISRADVIHTGLFQCVASSIAGNTSVEYELVVNVPPIIFGSEFPINESVTINNAITLDCTTTATPEPTIEWYNGNVPLEGSELGVRFDQKKHQLTIENAQLVHDGVYRCIATNEAGQEEKYFNLQVQVPSTITDLNEGQVNVMFGSEVQLSCDNYGIPAPVVTWYKGENFIPVDSSRFIQTDRGLFIAETSTTDTDLFRCLATNPAGEAERRIYLQVLVAPMITGGLDTIKTVLGRRVRLPCDVSGTPKPLISWQKNYQILDESNEGYRVLANGMLYIEKATIDDAGIYRCIATNQAGTTAKKIELQVQVAPMISIPENFYTAVEDEAIILECSATGIPHPEIQWLHNGIEINDRRVKRLSGSLQIPFVRAEDTGRYTCLARNDVSSVSGTIQLQVLVPPTITKVQDSYNVGLYSRAALPCVADGAPKPEISWTKDGQPIEQSSRYFILDSGTLVFDRVERTDAGQYVCTATNLAGRMSNSVALVVKVRPDFVVFPNDLELAVYEELELSCKAIGTPTPVITWKVNNTIIPGTVSINGSSTYRIVNVMKEDAGKYTCVAENSAGSRDANAIVRIRVPPRIMKQSPRSWTAIPQSMTMFDCEVIGFPDPRVMWFKDGEPVSFDNRIVRADNNSLVIYDTSEIDSGLYRCVGINEAGEASVISELRVSYPPQFLIEPVATSASQGELVRLDCIAQGIPVPVMTWHAELLGRPGSYIINADRQSQQFNILANNSLVIVAAQLPDSGMYTCKASNEFDTIISSAQVTIRVDGNWSPWQQWGACSKTCKQQDETGMQKRLRLCNNPMPANDGRFCVGTDAQFRECNTNVDCPIDGGFGSWSPWEPCSKTCGRGIRTRERKCNNPSPQYGGRECEGRTTEQVLCIMGECDVDGRWTEWGAWGDCSVSCGEGISQRQRMCTPPMNGGKPCEGRAFEINTCSPGSCIYNGGWSDWSDWSVCSVSCDGGEQFRSRSCNDPTPSPNGLHCEGLTNQFRDCHTEACIQHGNWGEWAEWEQCDRPCGVGRRVRRRECNNPPPSLGGRTCLGQSIHSKTCTLRESCDGNWSAFGPWSDCPATCGQTFRVRERVCDNPRPILGGASCYGLAVEQSRCVVPPCFAKPTETAGTVSGSINDIKITGGLLYGNFTSSSTETVVNSVIFGIPPKLGNSMRILLSMISPIFWTVAKEVNGAANGLSLTNGIFQQSSRVEFNTGQTLYINVSAMGMDEQNSLNFDVTIDGNMPDFQTASSIRLIPYEEEYHQLADGILYAKSTRNLFVDNRAMPYIWNHTIHYIGDHMPFLIQRLNAKELQTQYSQGRLIFLVRASIEPDYEYAGSGTCPLGFIYDPSGPFCVDQDECNSHFQVCADTCHNTLGGYYCSCPPGFVLSSNGRSCNDLNECVVSINGGCPNGTQCFNTFGSFQCLVQCTKGYTLSDDGTRCVDVDECTAYRRGRCAHECRNTIGSYVCICRPGFELVNQRQCREINECKRYKDICSKTENCRNNYGSYTCICKGGYQRNDGFCKDVDECTIGTYRCSPNSECSNTEGSYLCNCKPGYRQRDGICVDINECMQANVCLYQCKNTDGDYECICPPGQINLSDGKSCVEYRPDNTNREIVENTSVFSCPPNKEFINTDCFCKTGYIETQTGSCIDVNECITEIHRCATDDLCINTEGSYSCFCPSGYRLNDQDQVSCDDINECENYNCGLDKTCFNMLGSFRCIDTPCPAGYSRTIGGCVCQSGCQGSRSELVYRTIALKRGIQKGQDLLRLYTVYETGDIQRIHTNSVYTVINEPDEEAVPFAIRPDLSGGGMLYTLKEFNQMEEFRVKVQAIGYSYDRRYIDYKTTFVIYISISAYTF